MADWKEIWSRTRQLPAEKQDLQFLIEADGFNSGAGKIAAPDWLAYIEYVTQLARIAPDDSIYEIGCGSGAFLYPFYQNERNNFQENYLLLQALKYPSDLR